MTGRVPFLLALLMLAGPAWADPTPSADPSVTAADDTTPVTTVNRPIAVASARDWNAALT